VAKKLMKQSKQKSVKVPGEVAGQSAASGRHDARKTAISTDIEKRTRPLVREKATTRPARALTAGQATKSTNVKVEKPALKPSEVSTKGPRRKQQRAIETRKAILEASLLEFSKKGFDAASIRDIADRLGIRHPLITYHFRTKEILWRAVADQLLTEFREDFMNDVNLQMRNLKDVTPIGRVRALFKALMSVQYKYPHLHHFMQNEGREKGSRLQWLANHILVDIVNSNLPEIRRAQAMGDLPRGEPVMLHYMLVAMTSALVSVSAEIETVTGFVVEAPGVKDAYFDLIDRVMFGRKFTEGH
jgi:TetR/AcrR family transcriptional regulator